MGNAVPHIDRHEAMAPLSGAKTPVASGRTARSRHAGKVARDAVRRRGAEDERKVGGGGTVVMTVKVVVSRKEAEKLVARMEEHNAKERKARIAEITRRLRATDGSGGGSPVTCRGTWTPRLAAIQEV